jgi:aryl-alcohol dehydrogenase-like predicted oxidoreductase
LSKQRREDFVIATKVRGKSGPQVNDVGLSRKHIMASVETSLKRLKTTYIGKKYSAQKYLHCKDLYQIHSFDVETPLEETFK